MFASRRVRWTATVAFAFFLMAPAPHAEAAIDPNAEVVLVRVDCGSLDDCFTTMASLTSWISGTRQPDAVIGPEEDDRVVRQPVFYKLFQKPARPSIHGGNQIAIACPILACDGRIGVIRRQSLSEQVAVVCDSVLRGELRMATTAQNPSSQGALT